MKPNTPHASIVKITVLIAFFSFGMANAQTKKFATSTPAVATTSGVDVLANANDSNLATKARITSSTLSNSRYIELIFPQTVPANTPAYVKVAMQDNQFAALIGGSLGDLLANLLGGLIGGQQVRVQAKKGPNTTTDVVLDSQTAGFATESLKVVRDGDGNYYVRITPTQDYSRIRITNTVPALSASKWLDVYDGFYIEGATACGIGTYTSFDGTGLVNLADTGVTNPHYAIDSNTANYSSMSLGLLGVTSTVEQSVYFEGPSQATDVYMVKLRVSPSLLSLGLLDSVDLIAYRNGSVVSTYNVDSSLLSADLLGLLNQGLPISIPFSPGQAADKITVRMTGIGDLGLPQNLELYGVVRSSFGLTITGGGSYQVNAPVTLSAVVAGCNSPYTYTWEGVTDSDANAQPSTAVPGTYTYSVTVTDKYGIQEKVSVQVVVEAPPVAGTAGSSQAVCAGTTPSDVALTGYTGTILRWERSTSPSFSGATTIANTTASLSGAAMGALEETTYFRAVIKHNSYPEVYSQPAVMTVKKTTWNGSAWSNGVPDIETTIYFTGNYTATADLFGCSLNVSNNANVVIPPGFDVTLYGAITVTSGTFKVQTNSNLVQQSNAENSGNIIVEKNSSLLYRLDYTLWCAPVVGTQTLQEFSPGTLSNRFYVYNTASDMFAPITPNIPFALGKGYHIRMPNGDTTPGYNAGTTAIRFKGIFLGKPNNGNISIPLSQEGTRYSAVGNPYASAINVHNFIDANLGALDATAVLYFWRKKNDSEQPSYATLTKLAYTSNSALGGDTSEGVFVGDPSLWVINPCQGFIIQAKVNGTPLVFNNAMRRSSNNGQFFRTANNGEPALSRLWLNITSGNSFAQAAIGYLSEGTLGIDPGWDGKAIIGENDTAIYTVAESIPLAIQARPSFEDADVVPVSYKARATGTYTISLDHMDGVFEQGQDIYLRDNVLGVTHDLKQNGYEFTTEAGTFESRFDIVYAEALGTANVLLNPESIILYKQDNGIMISSGGADITGISVYDMRGRLLYSAKDTNSTETMIHGLQAEQQVLVVSVSTLKGEVSKKIVF